MTVAYHKRQRESSDDADPAPDEDLDPEAGGHQRGINVFDGLGVGRIPGNIGEGDTDAHQGQQHRYQRGARGLPDPADEDQRHNDQSNVADKHIRFADTRCVREEADHDREDDKGYPENAEYSVGLGQRNLEAGGHKDDEEAPGGEVQKQKEVDVQGADHQARTHHLTPAVAWGDLGFDLAGAGLDERFVLQRGHHLGAQAE